MADKPAFVPMMPGMAASLRPGQARVETIKNMVALAKSKRLTIGEHAIVAIGALSTLPFFGLTGLVSVPTNTKVAIFRFGKLTSILTTPGLHYVAPFYNGISEFAGAQVSERPPPNSWA